DAPSPRVVAQRDAGFTSGDGILYCLIHGLFHVLIVAEDRGAVLNYAVTQNAGASPDAIFVNADFLDRVHDSVSPLKPWRWQAIYTNRLCCQSLGVILCPPNNMRRNAPAAIQHPDCFSIPL